MNNFIFSRFSLTIDKVVQEVDRRMMILHCSIRTSSPWIGLCSTITIGFGISTIYLCLVPIYLVELILLNEHVLVEVWSQRKIRIHKEPPIDLIYSSRSRVLCQKRHLAMVGKSSWVTLVLI